MYDFMFYGAPMFPSNGNHLVRAVKKDRMPALEAVEKLIEGDHPKALGKLLAEHDKFNADTRKQAFEKVIAARKLECFTEMYQNDGYSRSLTAARHRLLMQLHDAGWQEALDVAFKGSSNDSEESVFKFITLEMPDDIRRRVIRHQYRISFDHMLKYAAGHCVQWMPHFMSMMQQAPDANKLAQLAITVLKGAEDAEAVGKAFDFLLARGMNVNHDNGAVMVAVLAKGYLDMAQQLIDTGFEPALSGATVYERLCAVGAPRAGIEFIKQFTGAGTSDVAAVQDGFTRSDDYSVSCVQVLPNGGQLTMLFNFATAQQIVIAQMGDQMAAPAIVPFSHIENRHLLDKAAAAFVAGGGDEELAASAGMARKSPLAKPQAGV